LIAAGSCIYPPAQLDNLLLQNFAGYPQGAFI
jgi:hypothetical protein